jgi:glycine cleavage system H protein
MATNIPADLRYSKSDEWVRTEGDEVVIGITDYAQDALGDIVYLELPQVGATLTPGAPFGVIESVKASSDLNTPVGGEVVAVNSALEGDQQPINGDPYGDGWLIRVKLADAPEDLMDAEAYTTYCESRAH